MKCESPSLRRIVKVSRDGFQGMGLTKIQFWAPETRVDRQREMNEMKARKRGTIKNGRRKEKKDAHIYYRLSVSINEELVTAAAAIFFLFIAHHRTHTLFITFCFKKAKANPSPKRFPHSKKGSKWWCLYSESWKLRYSSASRKNVLFIHIPHVIYSITWTITVKSQFNEWPPSAHFDSLNRDYAKSR